MPEPQTISLLLADDHAMVRRGIREFLESDASLRVVAEASDGEHALALARELKPDVVVADIQMPGKTGIELTRALREAGMDVGVLILTAYDDEPFIINALQAGANGYVLKTAEPEELIGAVHAVHEGKSALDVRLIDQLMHRVAEWGTREAAVADTLTGREIEVLRLAARGYTNKAIVAQLSISDRTVQGHLANIFSKLNAQSRTDAVMIGLRLGLISITEP